MSLRYAIEARILQRSGAIGRGAALAALFCWSGCFVDEDHRCDANQVLLKGNGGFTYDSCACVPNAVPDARGYGCTLCGANEIVSNDKCVCAPGYSRTADNAPCEMAAIGLACTGNEGCSDPFPYCATDGADRYCSAQNCSATSCPTGYACEQASGSSYCRKLPEGLGKACTSNADCATAAGQVCDTQQSFKCILTGCATKQTTCPGYWACCDVSAFVPGFSVCADPGSHNPDGSCAFGTKVTP